MLQYIIVFIWGLLTVLAFVGWGEVVNRLAGRPQGDGADHGPDWGLKAGWGMALALFVGGAAALLGIATTAFAISFVLVGAALQFAFLARPRFSVKILRNPCFLAACLAAAFVLWQYAAWTHSIARNCNDDDIAYYPFIIRLLETGTLIDPFSIRRLVSFGGHSFLQSLVVAAGSVDNGLLLDRGIAVIINYGLVLGIFRSRQPIHYAFAVLMAIFLPITLVNSSSAYTGLAMFLTLYRTLTLIPDPDKAGLRRLFLIGLIMAGASSMRTHFILAMAVFVTSYWLFRYLEQRRPARRYVVSLIQSGLASALFLVPWMALLQISSGTPLFPLFKGNQKYGVEMFDAPISAAEHMGLFIDFLTSSEMVFFIPLLFAARLLKYPAALALYAAAVVSSLFLLFIFSYADISGIARYAHPFTSAAFICALAALLSDLPKKSADSEKEGISPVRGGEIMLVVIVAALALFSVFEDVKHLQADWGQTLDKSERRAAYVELQETIPEGASFLTMVDRPFYFDFTRNDVLGIDTPGTISPAPGMPFYKGPEALKSYLLSLSIRYVAFRDFDRPIDCRTGVYNRWVGKKPTSDRWFRMQSNYYLDVMDNIQALAASQKRLYDSNGLTAFEIR